MASRLPLFIVIILALIGPTVPAWAQSSSPAYKNKQLDAPLPLSAYPRPNNDNGMGIHWSTNLYGQSDDATDYFVNELKEMGIKWVKIVNEHSEGRHYDYLIEQLVANDIMPIVRLYTRCNEPLNLGTLGKMVNYYLPKGVYYYELYNEPDLWGVDGGWCEDGEPDPEYLARIWAPSAREVLAQGGYPSLPSIFPVGKNVPGWENSFFQRFLKAVKANGDTEVLYGSWGAVHNYFLNHPPDYPQNEVNLTGQLLTPDEISKYKLNEAQIFSINQARSKQHEPGGYYVGSNPTQDVSGFLQFVGYHDQFVELFGFEIPLISTEGGATVGSCEDPRYPCVDEQLQMEWTLASYEYMLNEAPEYYFANNTWLIAQQALDFHGGYIWEGNAWYHDREGNHLPIVDALKNHPRKGQARWDQQTVDDLQPVVDDTAPFSSLSTDSDTIASLSAISRLAQYPRPVGDNGRGAHYSPTIMGQPTNQVDFFIDELLAMNMKWVKLMQGDIPKVEHQYLIEQLVANDIEPVLRVYKPYNEPYEHLGALVANALPMGVHYFELYNEPNIGGFPGGWRDGEAISVERMLDLWIPAAEAIQHAGGYPGLPTLAVGGDYDDMLFLKTFLDGLVDRQRTKLLEQAWLPLHNYFLNHPFDYPNDPVNLNSIPLGAAEISDRNLTPSQVDTINSARANAQQPGGYYVGSTVHEDSNGFRKFEAYAKIFHDRFGYYIPIITTEGGPIAGDNQDPRYPPITNDDVTKLTLQAYHAMLDEAPAYYFAFMPWLLANKAGGHWDNAWEDAAWYKLDGTTLPVVDALKTDPRRQELRKWESEPKSIPSMTEQQLPFLSESQEPSLGIAAPTPSTEILPGGQSNSVWKVVDATWRTAASKYPRLRINVLNTNGYPMAGQQVRVEWSGGWTLLITEADQSHSVSMPLIVPNDTYFIKLAGGSGEGIKAKGAEGFDLNATFQLVSN
ncbi:MAG: hypothetical protein KDJ52_08830 [Anaerolineae bacterium]|nr:hypothetical protein [Anaerolineae bacterium]